MSATVSVVRGLVAVPLLAACGGGAVSAPPAPTAAPAGQAASAPIVEPTAPPAAGATAAPTTAAGAAATPTATPAPVTSPNATPTEAPVTKALPTPQKSGSKITGKFQVLQDQDFNPYHNAYVRKGIQDFANFQGWPLDLSYVAGFSAGGSLPQKLAAAVNAGTPPDIIAKDLSAYQYKFLGIIDDADDITKEMLQKYGDTIPGIKRDAFIDGKWWCTPFFTRSGGRWGRKDIFEAAGLDAERDTADLYTLPDTLLKVSNPSKQMWGWGMTANTCGDGETLVQNTLMSMGSRLTDETGQVVHLNSPETVTAIKWLADIYTNPKWKDMLPPGIMSWTDPSNNEAWLANKIPYTDNAGTLYAQTIQQNKSFAKDAVILQEPKAKDRLQGAGGARFFVFKGSKNKDASKDLIRYLLDPVSQKSLWLYTPGYVCPAYKRGWSDPDFRKDPNAVRFEAVAWDPSAYNGIAYPGPNTAAASAVNDQNVYTKLAVAVIGGKKAEDAVAEAHASAVKIYKDFGMKGE